MDRKLINPAIVQDIAAAIREKGGQTEPIVVNALGDAIRALPQGMGDNTTEVVEAISGEQPEGDIAIANAIAKGATDAAREHVWQGSRATDEGRELRNGVAFVSSLKGRTDKVVQLQRVSVQTKTINQVSLTFNGMSVIANGTVTDGYVNDAFGYAANVVDGHKYFLCGCPEGGSATTYYISDQASNFDFGKGKVFIANYGTSVRWFIFRIYEGVTCANLTFTPQLFDLTAMGMEDVVDADDFAHRLGYADASSLPYIPYGEQIINSKPTEVVSKKDGAVLSTLPLLLSSILHGGQPLFPTGELCGLDDDNDVVELAKGKAVKRIGVVDLGDFDVSAYNTNTPPTEQNGYMQRLYVRMTGLIKSEPNYTNHILVAGYSYAHDASASAANYYTVFSFADGRVFFNVPSTFCEYDREAFKAAIKGTILFFVLANPIEVTFDPAKAFYRVQNGGSEEAVMDGLSAPLVADIAYRDNMAYSEEAALLAFANERSGQNDADLGDAIRTLSE